MPECRPWTKHVGRGLDRCKGDVEGGGAVVPLPYIIGARPDCSIVRIPVTRCEFLQRQTDSLCVLNIPLMRGHGLIPRAAEPLLVFLDQLRDLRAADAPGDNDRNKDEIAEKLHRCPPMPFDRMSIRAPYH